MPKCAVSLGSRAFVEWRQRFACRRRNPLTILGRKGWHEADRNVAKCHAAFPRRIPADFTPRDPEVVACPVWGCGRRACAGSRMSAGSPARHAGERHPARLCGQAEGKLHESSGAAAGQQQSSKPTEGRADKMAGLGTLPTCGMRPWPSPDLPFRKASHNADFRKLVACRNGAGASIPVKAGVPGSRYAGRRCRNSRPALSSPVHHAVRPRCFRKHPALLRPVRRSGPALPG